MMCQSEIAPQNMSADVGSVCTLMTDLSAVPRSEFTRLTTSKGAEYLNLDFSLDFIVDSASLMFELKVGGVSLFLSFFLSFFPFSFSPCFLGTREEVLMWTVDWTGCVWVGDRNFPLGEGLRRDWWMCLIIVI